MYKKLKKDGFTMTEMVVTVALIGTLLSFAVPRYTSVSEDTQAERNIANMQVIREAFFHYFLTILSSRPQNHFWTIFALWTPLGTLEALDVMSARAARRRMTVL